MRKALLCMCCLGLIASVALADKPTPQKAELQLAVPDQVALINTDGKVLAVMDDGVRQECQYHLVFDAFEPDVIVDPNDPNQAYGYYGCNPDPYAHFYPCGGGTCGLGEPDDCDGGRWYNGEGYNAPYSVRDMVIDPTCGGMWVDRLEYAFHWYVTGPCQILIYLHENYDDLCSIGDNDPNTAWGPAINGTGVQLSYNNLPAGNWFSDVDLCGTQYLQLPQTDDYAPFDGQTDGCATMYMFTDIDNLELGWGHFFLWGTGGNEYPLPDTVNRGEGTDVPTGASPTSDQGDIQWDDDNPVDLQVLPPAAPAGECYTMLQGLCPDPLGVMVCFYVDTPGCVGDLDGDGDTDEGDLAILLADWWADTGAGDLDGDGDTDEADLSILLADWGCGT
jgi:hypothetical protein